MHLGEIIGANSKPLARSRHGGNSERTVSGLWDLIGKLVDLFQPNECVFALGASGNSGTVHLAAPT
jgi:hypothetical protein